MALPIQRIMAGTFVASLILLTLPSLEAQIRPPASPPKSRVESTQAPIAQRAVRTAEAEEAPSVSVRIRGQNQSASRDTIALQSNAMPANSVQAASAQGTAQGTVGTAQGTVQGTVQGTAQPFTTLAVITEVQVDGGSLAPLAAQSLSAPIGAANISVDGIGTKILPEDHAAKRGTSLLPLPGGEERAIGHLTYHWQSANICHWPLYFEEPMLERHGQQVCPAVLQPAVSGTKFLSNLLLYPYKATLQPALESRYTLGHFRPGSAAPRLRDTLPWSPRAAAVQGAAVTGVVVGLPW